MLLKKFEALTMKKNLICLAIATLCTSQVLAADLQSELIFLRENHPMLRATSFALTAAEKRETAAQAGWYPKIDLAAESGSERITTTPYASGLPSPTSQASNLQRQKKAVRSPKTSSTADAPWLG